MAQQDLILNKAIEEIGTYEADDRSVKYSNQYGLPKQDWCVMFVWWVFFQCGLSNLFLNGRKTASCGALYQYALNNNYLTSNPQKGDLALFNWDGNRNPQHIGIVEKVSTNKVTTIEGNTIISNHNNGVARKTRSTEYVVAYIHPAYSETVTTPTTTDNINNDTPITEYYLDYGHASETAYEDGNDIVYPNGWLFQIGNYYIVPYLAENDSFDITDLTYRCHKTRYPLKVRVSHWNETDVTRQYFYLEQQGSTTYQGVAFGAINKNTGAYAKWGWLNQEYFSYIMLNESYEPDTWAFDITRGSAGTCFIPSKVIFNPLCPFIIEDKLGTLNPKEEFNMQVKLWKNFTKRKNSTKRPTGGETLDVHLKSQCNKFNPRFIVNKNDYTYNYCSAFGLYYYITDIISINNNMIELVCSIDPLASYKNEIQNLKTYINYCSSYDNDMLIDKRCNTKELHNNLIPITIPNICTKTNGLLRKCYSIQVLNSETGDTEFVTTYVCLSDDVTNLVSDFMTTSGSASWVDDLNHLVDKPISAFVKCTFLPFDYTSYFDYDPTKIKIGNHEFDNASGWLLSDSNRVYKPNDINITLPWSYSDFRRNEPYSKLSVYCPLLGIVELPTNSFVDANSITIKTAYDLVTGDITLIFGKTITRTIGDLFIPITTINYNLSYNIPIASQSYNTDKIITSLSALGGSAGTLASGIATQNPLKVGAGAAGLIASSTSIPNAFSLNSTIKSTTEGISMLAAYDDFKLIYNYHSTDTLDNDYTTYKGRPYEKINTISNLSGYIECSDATIDCTAPDNIKEQINSFLNTGFYLE